MAQPNSPSRSTKPTLESTTPNTLPQENTTLERTILKTLSKEHNWTALRTHTPNLSPSPSPPSPSPLPQPLPLLSGLPPTRLYISPRDQDAFLKGQTKFERERQQHSGSSESSSGSSSGTSSSSDAIARKDAFERAFFTPVREYVACVWKHDSYFSLARLAATFDVIEGVRQGEGLGGDAPRVLLGIVDSDSTVVFYVVHEGMVKARQN